MKITSWPFDRGIEVTVGLQTKDHSRQTAKIVVDSVGIWCPPTPTTDLYKAWRKANLGDTIELRASEPTIEGDVRAWAKKSGNRVIEVTHEKEYTRLVILVTKRGEGGYGDVSDEDEHERP